MKLFRIILIALFVFISVQVEAQEEDKKLKIFFLHSFEQNHFCGSPQMYGAKEALSELKLQGYKFNLREFYMNTKTMNVSPASMREVAKIARDSIQDFNPDYVIVFDDNAFKYVAIPYLLSPGKDWKVIFSGLNKKIDDYKEQERFDNNRIAGVQEIYQLRKLRRWFDSVGFIPNHFYIFRDSSPASFLMTKNIQSELKKYGHKNYTIVHMDSIEDLRSKIKFFNSKPKGVIFAVQTALVESSTGKVWTMFDILKEISKRNTRHLEVAINAYATKPDLGFAIASGPDFYEMGYSAGQILSNIISSDKFESTVQPAINLLTVNTNRMGQLRATIFYKNALNQFDTIDTSIGD